MKTKEQQAKDDAAKLRRRIEDYLRKYASDTQLEKIALLLGIKTD